MNRSEALDRCLLRCEADGCAEADAGCSLGLVPRRFPALLLELNGYRCKLTQFFDFLKIFYHSESRSIAHARRFLLIYMLRDTVKIINGYVI